MALGSTQPLTEMSTRNISWGGKGGQCVGLTTLPSFMCRLSRNLEASTSWNPKGLSRPVMGLLLLYSVSHLLHITLHHVTQVQDPLRIKRNIRCLYGTARPTAVYEAHRTLITIHTLFTGLPPSSLDGETSD
jgi:hypothetical protein